MHLELVSAIIVGTIHLESALTILSRYCPLVALTVLRWHCPRGDGIGEQCWYCPPPIEMERLSRHWSVVRR